MLVTSKIIPLIERSIDQGKSFSSGDVELSLSAVLYFALAGYVGRLHGSTRMDRFLEGLDGSSVSTLIELIANDGLRRADNPHGTYAFEAFRVQGKQDLLTNEWNWFGDRFRRAVARKKASPAALAMASVFREMVDNIVCHAYQLPEGEGIGLAGYWVSDHSSGFSVVDLGDGFLASLKRNPVWGELTNDLQALDAVVSCHATSRIGEATGGGFKQLFEGLLKFGALVILRSGTITLTLRGDGVVWSRVESSSYRVPGAQVTVIIGRDRPAEEEAVNI